MTKEELEKENAELKEELKDANEKVVHLACRSRSKQLEQAKEIIKELLDTQSQLDPYRDIFKDRILKAEQFLKDEPQDKWINPVTTTNDPFVR